MSVALVIKHVEYMNRILLSFVACLALPYISTVGLSHERHDFRERENITVHFDFLYQFWLKRFPFDEEFS